ncbi:hypothetical protein PCL_10635 [Purpureocillium lilacinum]|uniref:Uncharacterized protein n=1 Tax=Purpureocillium lilacinum TaxID=33203 RepID=A0A2U3EBZ3_PURLI|nr:hypothetical protein PCL_10635 [Purpureocillium lilacinum]
MAIASSSILSSTRSWLGLDWSMRKNDPCPAVSSAVPRRQKLNGLHATEPTPPDVVRPALHHGKAFYAMLRNARNLQYTSHAQCSTVQYAPKVPSQPGRPQADKPSGCHSMRTSQPRIGPSSKEATSHGPVMPLPMRLIRMIDGPCMQLPGSRQQSKNLNGTAFE